MSQEATIKKLLQSCPAAGEGVNRWLFPTARKLHRLGVEPARIEELLEEATVDCGRGLKPDEIPRAVRNSAPGALASRPGPGRWPQRNYEQIEAIGVNGLRFADLARHSPEPVDCVENQTERLVDMLFPGDPLICAGASLSAARTLTREQWRGRMGRQQFIVPSPMSKARGVTAEGRNSPRSLDNTGPRRFLVVEFDFSESDKNGNETAATPMLRRLGECGVTVADLCVALHAELAKYRPLALVLHSGGKSLHGWYPCDGEKEEDSMLRFMRFAVSLGADPATWTRAQFVRMPDGVRNNGKRQRVLYFNPRVIGGAK